MSDRSDLIELRFLAAAVSLWILVGGLLIAGGGGASISILLCVVLLIVANLGGCFAFRGQAAWRFIGAYWLVIVAILCLARSWFPFVQAVNGLRPGMNPMEVETQLKPWFTARRVQETVAQGGGRLMVPEGVGRAASAVSLRWHTGRLVSVSIEWD